MISFNRTRTSPIGLHLGPRSATLVQLTGPPGEREVHALACAEMPYEEHASPEQQDRETAAALRKLIADHRFHGRKVVSCLGAQELFVQNVRLPKLPEEEVEKVVLWEAEERLPYPVPDAEIRHLLAGEIRQDADVKQEVILLACHRGVVDRHINLLEEAGLAPVAIDIEPCAVLRCLQQMPSPQTPLPQGEGFGVRAEGNEQRCAYLSLGERSTTVLFAEAERILFLKYISSGGHHLDLAVARSLELDPAEAARIRATVTASAELDPDDDVHRSVINAIRNPLEAISSEIELCFRYYKVTFRGKPLQKVVVTGSEASPWLATFLSERLGIVCELGNPFDSLPRGPTAASVLERPGRWTTAMGLSLRA